ncbi:GDSL esterase/lipase [Acorus gramineus]|uniref:GDSL esterase/lipase n=1 Tax=Acorus gramineus TaxID=55184 RepID=A0AAV9A8H1_ACOGR|nr:GDSL esterase/lipase [Acorus gramineus]
MANPSLHLTLLTCLASMAALISKGEAARAFFVFGDSLVDNGNNDFLFTTARADAYPYGIDTPSHRPTGRFSNGKNIPDIISEQLGAEPTLPYLSPQLQGQRLLVGANFASAGIGILNDTGIQFLNIIRIGRQLQYFQQYQQRLSMVVGYAEAQRVRLYNLGARRVLVTGTGPLGCVPAELAMRSRDGNCDVELQRAAGLFNPQLVNIINELNQEAGAEVFVSANAFDMHMDYITNPQQYGQIFFIYL